jgi:hypothetical protein
MFLCIFLSLIDAEDIMLMVLDHMSSVINEKHSSGF